MAVVFQGPPFQPSTTVIPSHHYRIISSQPFWQLELPAPSDSGLLSAHLSISQLSAEVLKLSAFTFMSHTQSAAMSSSKSHVLFNNALDTFRKRTENDLLTHPLATRLQACDTPAAILAILREQIDGLDQSRSGAERWSKWLDPTVNVLFAFSVTIGAGAGPVGLGNCTHSKSAFS